MHKISKVSTFPADGVYFSHSHNPYNGCTPPPAVDFDGWISNRPMFLKIYSVSWKMWAHL